MAARALAGKTLFITGASRGIGKAIALRAAQDGANIVVAAKTAEPHPKLPGTIYTAAEEIEKAGGKCLPLVVDIRSDNQVFNAVKQAAEKFGGIDILVNNASAIQLTGTMATEMKRFDLMMSVNTRGTFLCSQACIPYLQKAKNPHILNLSPPLNMRPRWFKDHVAYTMAKYGMSMCVLGMSEELRPLGIAVNALWPKTAIFTAAMEMLGGKAVGPNCRKPEIVADAAHIVLTKSSRDFTGNFLIDEDVLRKEGITDFDKYLVSKEGNLMPDFFLDEDSPGTTQELAAKKVEPASQKPPPSVSRVFNKLERILEPELIDTIKSTYLFELNGSDPGSWYLDLKNKPGQIAKGAPPEGVEPPDCKLIMLSEDFVKLTTGKLKATEAFFSGKLKLSGSIGAAMRLDKVLKKAAQAKTAKV